MSLENLDGVESTYSANPDRVTGWEQGGLLQTQQKSWASPWSLFLHRFSLSTWCLSRTWTVCT